MIVKMKKYTFVGPGSQKDRFIRKLQDLGVTHITLPAEAIEPTQISKEIQRVAEIRKFLAKLSKKTEVAPSSSDYSEICARKEALSKRETDLTAQIVALSKDRAALEVWGDFEPEDIAFLREKGVQTGFFKMPNRAFEKLAAESVYCHIVKRTEGDVTFVAFYTKPMDFGVNEEKLPGKRLSVIEGEIARCAAELSGITREYEALAEKVRALTDAETALSDEYEYKKVLMNVGTVLDDKVFVLTCWSPLPEKVLIPDIGDEFAFGHFCESPTAEDKVPILLSNKPAFDSGEDLVKIYSQPNYTDFDPSGIVLYCFAIFYGMIIGDAGYGFVFLALTGYLHWKVKSKTDFWIRFRRLSYMLAVSVLFFGVIGASYFGVSLDPGNPLTKVMLINMGTKEGQSAAMLFSIIVGMIHISVALGIKCYRVRDYSSLGWIAVIWSGYALTTSKMIHGVDNPIAAYILIAGLAVVVLFTSNSRNPIIRVLLGLNGALGIVQLFSDILSYLRLFALGLATMYMCQTFNMLAKMPYDAIPYVGIIPAILILIAGHGINILLGIMGGVVHGLRLNFLEWYRWCFEGDGVPFKPFRRITGQV